MGRSREDGGRPLGKRGSVEGLKFLMFCLELVGGVCFCCTVFFFWIFSSLLL